MKSLMSKNFSSRNLNMQIFKYQFSLFLFSHFVSRAYITSSSCLFRSNQFSSLEVLLFCSCFVCKSLIVFYYYCFTILVHGIANKFIYISSTVSPECFRPLNQIENFDFRLRLGISKILKIQKCHSIAQVKKSTDDEKLFKIYWNTPGAIFSILNFRKFQWLQNLSKIDISGISIFVWVIFLNFDSRIPGETQSYIQLTLQLITTVRKQNLIHCVFEL